MNAIVKFFGDFLSSLNANLGFAILFLACIIKVIMYIATKNDIKTLQIFDLIQPQYNDILKKFGKNKEKFTKELMMLQKNNGCRFFPGIDAVIIHSLIAACLTYIFTHAQYLPLFRFTSYDFLWISDLTFSPLNLITRQETSPVIELLGSLVFPAAAAVVYFYLAKYIARHSFMEKKNQQRVILAAIIAAGIFAPQAAGLYLCSVVILTALQYFITIKYLPLKKLKKK